MNVKFEIYVNLEEEEFNQEEVTRLTVAFSDSVVNEGYGNVAAKSLQETQLRSVVAVKMPVSEEEFEDSAKGPTTVAFTLPTADEDFIKQADAGGVKVIDG